MVRKVIHAPGLAQIASPVEFRSTARINSGRNDLGSANRKQE